MRTVSPPLRFLKSFHISARRGSFKAAADDLCITASAVSHQIKVLEDQLGLALFERGSRSLTLTAAGAFYLDHVEAVFVRLEAATEQLRMRFARQVVRLQVPPFFASEMLLPRLAGFSVYHSDTDIQVTTDVVRSGAHSADSDVSVLVGSGQWPDVQATALFPQTYVPACAPARLKRGPILKPADLEREALIAHNHRPHLWERWAAMCGIEMLRPKQFIHFDTMSAVVHAAEQGVGIALVSAPIAAARFSTGALARVFQEELTTGESYYLVTRAADAHRPGVSQLIGWMLKQYSSRSAHEHNLVRSENSSFVELTEVG